MADRANDEANKGARGARGAGAARLQLTQTEVRAIRLGLEARRIAARAAYLNLVHPTRLDWVRYTNEVETIDQAMTNVNTAGTVHGVTGSAQLERTGN